MQRSSWTTAYKTLSLCVLALWRFTSAAHTHTHTYMLVLFRPFWDGFKAFFPYLGKAAVFPYLLIPLQLPSIWKEMANVILNVHHILWGFSFVLSYLRVLRSKKQDAGEVPFVAWSPPWEGPCTTHLAIYLVFTCWVTRAKRSFENWSGKVCFLIFSSPSCRSSEAWLMHSRLPCCCSMHFRICLLAARISVSWQMCFLSLQLLSVCFPLAVLKSVCSVVIQSRVRRMV